MRAIEMICDRDRELLLRGWVGIPADRLEATIESFGLQIAMEDLGFREGALDLTRGLVLVNSRLPELCDPRTDLNGVRNSILAHELGHWRLHRCLLESGQKLDQEHENQAYVYAEEWLLPRCQLRERPQVWEMARARKGMKSLTSSRLWRLCSELAQQFAVTTSAVAYRLSGLRLIHRRGSRLSLTPSGEQTSSGQPNLEAAK